MAIRYGDHANAAITSRRRLIGTDEAAAYLNTAKQTLAIWRTKGTGPRFIRVGSRVKYDVADLDAWLDQRIHGGGDAA